MSALFNDVKNMTQNFTLWEIQNSFVKKWIKAVKNWLNDHWLPKLKNVKNRICILKIPKFRPKISPKRQAKLSLKHEPPKKYKRANLFNGLLTVRGGGSRIV